MTAVGASDSGLIVWEQPTEAGSPGGGKRSAKWDGIAFALRSHPHKWARIPHAKQPTAAKKPLRIRGDHFEITSRVELDGSFKVYARWNPPVRLAEERGA